MTAPTVSLLPNVFGHDYTAIPGSVWRQLRDAGIASIELGATTDPFPAQVVDTLRSFGFSFLGHGSSAWVMQQHLARFIQDAQARGEPHLLCYWPWLDAANDITQRQISSTAAVLNELGRRCSEAGLRFAFHNHGVEFATLDGRMICDLLLEETDPAFVSVELDLYHVFKAGADPIPFLDRHGPRISILHLNAMDGTGEASRVGDGMTGFERLLKRVPVAHWVIEGQAQRDPLRYAIASFRRLQELTRST